MGGGGGVYHNLRSDPWKSNGKRIPMDFSPFQVNPCILIQVYTFIVASGKVSKFEPPSTPGNIYTLLNVVVVGTRNNTHNTIQLHTLLHVVVVGTRNNTHNTIQLHTLLNVVVLGTRNNTHNTIQLHTLLNVVVCGHSKQHPQHHTTTHFVKCCCCGYSKQHPQHHTTTHFVKCCCCGYSKQHPQHHTTTHFANVVVVCHLWTIVWTREIYDTTHYNNHIKMYTNNQDLFQYLYRSKIGLW